MDFLHGDVLIRAGNNQYVATTVVGITDTGKYVFYDVTGMMPVNAETKEERSPRRRRHECRKRHTGKLLCYADEAYSEETKGKMTVRFWNPVMKNGVIEFLPPEQCPQSKTICEMDMKRFGADLNSFTGLREFGEVT